MGATQNHILASSHTAFKGQGNKRRLIENTNHDMKYNMGFDADKNAQAKKEMSNFIFNSALLREQIYKRIRR